MTTSPGITSLLTTLPVDQDHRSLGKSIACGIRDSRPLRGGLRHRHYDLCATKSSNRMPCGLLLRDHFYAIVSAEIRISVPKQKLSRRTHYATGRFVAITVLICISRSEVFQINFLDKAFFRDILQLYREYHLEVADEEMALGGVRNCVGKFLGD